VRCEDVPLAGRRLVAVAVYTFARAAELRALRWEDIDLEHGTIHVHRSHDRHANQDKSTKTRIARRFALEPMIVLVLAHMKTEADASGCKPTDAVLSMRSERTMSRALKRWLHRAKIDRPELFADDATRQALRFHDLRATGITWIAVRGDPGEQIKRRAGHTDYATTERYIREAEVLREGFGAVFPALPALSGNCATVRAKRSKVDPKYMKSKRGGRDSNASQRSTL
jgi:integrase